MLCDELTQGLSPLVCATLYLSEMEYTTISCLPQLVKGPYSKPFVLRRALEKHFWPVQDSQEMGESEHNLSRETQLSCSFSCHWTEIQKADVYGSWRQHKGQLKSLLSKKQRRRLGYMGANNSRIRSVFQAEGKNQHQLTSFSLTQTVSVRRGKNPGMTKRIQMVRNQVQTCFAEPAILKKQDPHRWWRGNKGHFPTLSKLARSFSVRSSNIHPVRAYIICSGEYLLSEEC